MRMKSPPHPGDFIKHEIIEPRDLNVGEAAKVLGVTRQALSDLLNEHASLSPTMALRIEKAFGVSMDTLLRMQLSYDIAQTRLQEASVMTKPYVPQMAKGMLPARALSKAPVMRDAGSGSVLKVDGKLGKAVPTKNKKKAI